MKPVIVSLVLAFCTIPHACLAQFGGNASYLQSSNSDRAAQNEHAFPRQGASGPALSRGCPVENLCNCPRECHTR